MKIKDVKTYLVGNPWKNWLFLRLETDEGLDGIGEGTLGHFSRTVETAVWSDDQTKGNYDIGINGSPATVNTPAEYWGKWYGTGSSGNWNRDASNPQFDALVEQLKIGGLMAIPVGSVAQQLRILRRTESGFETLTTLPVRFVPMTGNPR